MGNGYRTQPRGADEFLARLDRLEAQVKALRAAASIRNSRITGGTGLIVGNDGEPQVQLQTDPSDLVGGTVYFNDADDPNQAGGIRGSLNELSLFAPYQKDEPAVDIAEINLISGPSVGAHIQLSTGATGVGLWDADALAPGQPAQVQVDGFTFLSDAVGAKAITSSGSFVFPISTAECRVRAWDDSAYIPIRASAFTVSSTRAVKQDVRPLGWDPVDVVRKAKASRWRYTADAALDTTRDHVGPMVEDLPADLVDNSGETPGVDLHSLIGVLWAAVGQLAAEVADLRGDSPQ